MGPIEEILEGVLKESKIVVLSKIEIITNETLIELLKMEELIGTKIGASIAVVVKTVEHDVALTVHVVEVPNLGAKEEG